MYIIRVTDRMCGLPFMSRVTGNYKTQQAALNTLMKSPVKPFEYMIGTVGNYIHSAKFKQDIERYCCHYHYINYLTSQIYFSVSSKYASTLYRWSKVIENAAEGLLKERTCTVNYAPLYAMMEFQFKHFMYFCHMNLLS